MKTNSLLTQLISQHNSHPALITGRQFLRYADLLPLLQHVSEKLKEHDIHPGERVAILSENSPEYLILLLALWQVQAVAILLSPRWSPGQIENALKSIGCTKIFIPEKQSEKIPSEKIVPFLLEAFVTLPSTLRPFDTAQKMPRAGQAQRDSATPGAGQAKGSDHLSELGKIELQQETTIIFTSGSSGSPKAVLHTFANHFYSALGSNQNILFQPGDRWLLSLPLYHVGGLAILFRSLIGGGAVAIPAPGKSLNESLHHLGTTHLSLVATQLYRLLQNDSGVKLLQSLKAILLGGSAIPANLVHQAVEKRLPVFISYGSSEMASQITTTRPDDSPDHLLTAGKLLPYRQLKIAPDGEILVKGKTLFKGYVQGEQINPSRQNDGWFATGDLGYLDCDGYLRVTGRKDNLFISGGENIQPEEIEQALCQVKGVREAVVVPVKNEEFGYRPAAFVKMGKGFKPDKTRLRNELQKKIERLKIPDAFYSWPGKNRQDGLKLSREFFKKLASKPSDK